MDAAIERLTALAFVITGISHLTAPRAWAAFFIGLRERGEAGGLLNGWVSLPLGLLIVAFHPVWSGAGLLVTLIGWALTLKATLYFIWPGLALKSLAHVTPERAGGFRAAGAVAIALGVAIWWIGRG